ncbi:MAG: DUF4350 domain-containing protein [Candidatus Sericytochromatia bacterium]
MKKNINHSKKFQMRNLKLFITLSSINFLVFSCGQPEQIGSTPIPSKTPIPTATTNLAKIGSLLVKVTDGLTKTPINNAEVKLFLNNEATTGKTDTTGGIRFNDLVTSNKYSLEISAEGYITKRLSEQEAKIDIRNFDLVNSEVSLLKPATRISGKITDKNGVPIENASISIGNFFALSDAYGNYNLDVYEINNYNSIKISKLKFNNQNIENINFGSLKSITSNNPSISSIINYPDIKLESNYQKKILVDISKNPLGSTKDDNINNNFSSFSRLAKESSFQVDFDNLANLDSNTTDILFIPSPSLEYTDAEISKIINFVKSGKKLIISGEWGGFAGFSSNSVNKILAYANLKINNDLVKEKDKTTNPDFIVINTLANHAISKDISAVGFYSSASIDVAYSGINILNNDTTKIIANSSISSYKIKTFYASVAGIVAVSSIGNGKVIALGDTSIFTDSFSNPESSNILAYDNKKFVSNMLNW